MDTIVDMLILPVKLRSFGSVERLGPLLLSLALSIAFVSDHLRLPSSKFSKGTRILITRSELASKKLLYNNIIAFYKTSFIRLRFSKLSLASEVRMAVLLAKTFLSLPITLLIEKHALWTPWTISSLRSDSLIALSLNATVAENRL